MKRKPQIGTLTLKQWKVAKEQRRKADTKAVSSGHITRRQLRERNAALRKLRVKVLFDAAEALS